MAITREQVLTKVNSRTGREKVDIDDELLSAYQILAAATRITKDATVTVQASFEYVAQPTDMLEVIDVIQQEGDTPLDEITFRELKQRRRLDTSTGSSIATAYCVRTERIYIHPGCGSGESTPLKLFYRFFPEAAADTNPFPDTFDEAILEYVCLKVYEDDGMLEAPAAITHKQLFDQQLAMLIEVYKDKDI